MHLHHVIHVVLGFLAGVVVYLSRGGQLVDLLFGQDVLALGCPIFVLLVEEVLKIILCYKAL